MVAAGMAFGEPAVEVGQRALEDRRAGLRLVPGRIAEALELVRGGALCEALGQRLLVIGEDADAEGMAADDRAMRLSLDGDARHQDRRIDADGGDGVGGHARQEWAMTSGDHADAGRESAHQLPQPASLLVLHRRLAYAAGMVASRVSTRQVR